MSGTEGETLGDAMKGFVSRAALCSPALPCTSATSESAHQGCSYMTGEALTWPGRGTTFEDGPEALSSDCDVAGYRGSLWPGSFSHTAAQRERRSAPNG